MQLSVHTRKSQSNPNSLTYTQLTPLRPHDKRGISITINIDADNIQDHIGSGTSMRKNNRTNTQVNNNAANSKSTINATARPSKTASEVYGISPSDAYATIMGKVNDGLLICRKVKSSVYISCKGEFNPAITSAIRKEACVIADIDCWVAESNCYRAWDKAHNRYVIPRSTWETLEQQKPKSRERKNKRTSERKEQTEKTNRTIAPTEQFSLEQVLAIAKRLNKSVKQSAVYDAVESVTGKHIERKNARSEKTIAISAALRKLAQAYCKAEDLHNEEDDWQVERSFYRAELRLEDACKAEKVDMTAVIKQVRAAKSPTRTKKIARRAAK